VKEFNGISFLSVGSGTVIQYIQASYGNDDAFEWYGGKVDCSFLYANDDDNLDTDEGYRGTIFNAYCKNNNTNASADSRGIEFDNNPSNFTASPISSPTFRNTTLIGRGRVANGSQREGVFIRRGTKMNIDNIYIYEYATAIGVEHNETIAFLDNASKLNTVTMLGATKNIVGKYSKGFIVSLSNFVTLGAATGAGNDAEKLIWANFIG